MEPGREARRWLPAVVPVVLYNGAARWRAPQEVGDLIAPVGESLAPYQPSQRYVVVDEQHVREDAAPVGNLMRAVVGLEQSRTPADLTRDTLALDLTAAMLTCRLLAPAMRERGWGRIINVSSISARTGGGGGATAYAAAKAGLEAMTRSLAKELGAAGVTVNAVAPGVILTAIHDRINTPENLEALRLTTAVKRLGRPADCAGAVLFLASEAASYVTGSTIPVNGGMRMD